MAAITNPLYANYLLPGNNPTGNNIAIENPLDVMGGNNPFMSAAVPGSPTTVPTTMGFSTAGTVANDSGPAAASSPALPTSSSVPLNFPANNGAYSSSGSSVPTIGTPSNAAPGSIDAGDAGMFGFNSMSPAQESQMLHTLSDTYGPGVGDAIFNFLKTGAGFNQGVMTQYVNNLLASLQPGIQRGEESLMEQFSTSGNRFGSGAQIGLGDFESQVNLNEGQIISGAELQMYETSLNDYINTLMGAGSATANTRANQPSVWDTIAGVLGLTGSTASGVQGALGTQGGVLGGLAAL
jgi:hypothetical protein